MSYKHKFGYFMKFNMQAMLEQAQKMQQEMLKAQQALAEETVDDAVAAVALLRKREGVDPARIFVLGHSVGGMAAPRIASLAPGLAGIVILAGNSRPFGDTLVEHAALAAASGAPPPWTWSSASRTSPITDGPPSSDAGPSIQVSVGVLEA